MIVEGRQLTYSAILIGSLIFCSLNDKLICPFFFLNVINPLCSLSFLDLFWYQITIWGNHQSLLQIFLQFLFCFLGVLDFLTFSLCMCCTFHCSTVFGYSVALAPPPPNLQGFFFFFSCLLFSFESFCLHSLIACSVC